MQKPYDITIVGAGIAGLCLAYFAQQNGLNVAVIDQATPQQSTSWASGGMLAPSVEALLHTMPPQDIARSLAALAFYPDFIHQLTNQAKQSIHHGNGILFLSDQHHPTLHHGNNINTDYENALHQKFNIAKPITTRYFAHDGFVDPRQLLRVLTDVLQRNNVKLFFQTKLIEAQATSNQQQRLVTSQGTIVTHQLVLATGYVCNIAGISATNLPPLTADRGIMIHLTNITPPPMVLYQYHRQQITYIVPDPLGARLGSNSALNDLSDKPSNAETAELLERGYALWPSLRYAHVSGVTVGFRPLATPNATFCGPVDVDLRQWGLLGLHRHGILLAPLLAKQLVAQLLANNHY